MTVSGKAKELVDKYSFALMPLFTWGYNEQLSKGDLLRKAKQCATIAVDEILSMHMVYNMGRTLELNECEFYELVKEEIKNCQP